MSSKGKISVAVIFGGKSAEHEISLLSAKNIVNSLSPDKYDVTLIGINPKGQWKYLQDAGTLLNSGKLTQLSEDQKNTVDVVNRPGYGKTALVVDGQEKKIDVVFPILHGPYGEDGTIQGLLKLLDLPYVGPDIMASSVGMDKEVMKRLLRDAGIAVSNWISFRSHERQKFSYEEVQKRLGDVVFVKPANMGSSIGVHKVTNESQYKAAIEDAFLYDNKIVVEEQIHGREIECAVLGNVENPRASIPGEVVVRSQDGFYSYDAKYVDDQGAEIKIPADLSQDLVSQVQKISIQTFLALGCEGLSRVDMFVTEDKKIFINEINTIPGFTNISMYPKMWEASGISNQELVDQLIQLALQRFERDQKLKILKA